MRNSDVKTLAFAVKAFTSDHPDWKAFLHEMDCIGAHMEDDPEGQEFYCKCDGPQLIEAVEEAIIVAERVLKNG